MPEWSISANWAMGMARGIEYWLKMRMFMFDQVFICKHSYYTKWDAVTVYLYLCVGYYATRCSDLEVCLEAFACVQKTYPHIEGAQCGAVWRGMREIIEKAGAVLRAGR